MQNSIGMSLKGDGKSSPFGDLKDSSFKNKGDKQISKLKKILAKSSQIRNHSDNHFISEFISTNIYLARVAQQLSLDFVKNLFKNASVVELPPNKVICSQDQQINYLYTVLQGNAVALKRAEPFITQLQEEDTISRLIDIAVAYMKVLKRQSKVPSSKIVSEDFTFDFEDYEGQIIEENVQKYIHAHQACGMFDLSCEQNFLNTTITTENVTILVIPKKHLMICLEQAFKQKTNELLGHLKSIPCFAFLQTQKIKSIIQSMSLKKKKRNDYIYCQGDKANSIYFLSKGQVKLTKETNLFMENPNDLYVDRVQLLEELYKKDEKRMDRLQKIQTQRNKKKSILPYANLTTLYNYRPIKKNIEIGLLSPFCLFGEEQIIQEKGRQTNAFSESLELEYYEVEMKKIKQIITSKFMSTFMKKLRNSIRKKILYRQNQYASNITFQNKNNLDYFYYDGDKVKQEPRKFKLQKFNSKLAPPNMSLDMKDVKQPNVPAYYTSFNFNKLIRQKEKKQAKTEKGEQNSEIEHSPLEKKIMDISHTWKLMQKKVELEIKTSKKISPRRHVINLKKPLIEAEYFYHVDKEKKRIERDFRRRVLSLGKKVMNKSHQE